MAEKHLIRDCEILVIGGSAGSIEVIIQIFKHLIPFDHFAILIVLHRKDNHDSSLVNLLSHHTNIPISEVEDKDIISPGKIYLAPANYHLLVEKNQRFSLDASEKVNFSRPSIDVTFESVTDIYGPKVTGILLSGANSDGTSGMTQIKENGGITIVQQPKSAKVSYMPENAIRKSNVDYILMPDEIAEFINNLGKDV